MAKTVFKLRNNKSVAKSPQYWMLTLEDIPDNEMENELEMFAEDLRLAEFQEIDFVASRI
jgi:hypothetical protein